MMVRSIRTLMSRVDCDLSITDEEMVSLRAWIDERKKSNNWLINGTIVIALVAIVLAFFL